MFVKVSNPANPALFFDEEFQVDPTSAYSFAPEWRLEKIEIRPLQVREIILPNGRRELRLAGEGLLTGLPMLEPHICILIFSEENSPYVLGITAFKDLSLKKIALLMSQFASSRPRRTFEKGETVKIIDGPFAGFTGIVAEIQTDQNILIVLVTLFGRSTPIALDFWQVEKE